MAELAHPFRQLGRQPDRRAGGVGIPGIEKKLHSPPPRLAYRFITGRNADSMRLPSSSSLTLIRAPGFNPRLAGRSPA